MATQNSQIVGPPFSTVPQQRIGLWQGGQAPRSPPDATVVQVTPMIDIETHRSRAKGVAICDLCLSCCYMTMIFLFFLLAGLALAVLGTLIPSKAPEIDPTAFNFSHVHTALGITLTIVEIIAAVGLLKATKPATAPEVANRKANCWRLCSILFIFFNLNFGLLCIAGGVRLGSSYMIRTGIIYFVFFFLRLLFVFLVHGFIKRMEIMSSADSDPTTASMANTDNRNQQQQPYVPQGSSLSTPGKQFFG